MKKWKIFAPVLHKVQNLLNVYNYTFLQTFQNTEDIIISLHVVQGVWNVNIFFVRNAVQKY